MNKVTIDDVLWTMLDICLRVNDLVKKHPDYSYVEGVGITYDPRKEDDFAEYCWQIDEYKKLEELAKSLGSKYLLGEYYY